MCGYGYGWGGNGWGGGGGGILMTVLMFVLLVAVIVAIIFAVRHLSGSASPPTTEAVRAPKGCAPKIGWPTASPEVRSTKTNFGSA